MSDNKVQDILASVDLASMSEADRLGVFCQLVETGQLRTLVPLLPLVFNLNDGPYHLADYAPFESIFQTRLSRRMLIKSGRQLGKTITMAARGILLSVTIPNFSTLYVTPLYEQIRRFSTQYVRPFIERSPVRNLWVGANTENSVLQKSFKNFSKMFFSFALLDADRIRGVSAHAVGIDEIQDMDHNLIPIIAETLSASRWRLQFYTGTPKTLDNTIEGLWAKSSQAEWCIPCPSCKKFNVPRMGYDLEKMIGPVHAGIGPRFPTAEQKARKVKAGVPATVCAKCGHWIDPRDGRWVHQHDNRRWTFPGYHVPQLLMPMHCEDPERWSDLVAKQGGAWNYTTPKFYNEVLGESYDIGSRLINQTDIERAACLPWENDKNDPRAALARKGDYDLVVLGVDWGGGGEDEVSFTTCAVIGWRADGKIDTLYGERLLTPHNHIAEAERLLRIFSAFGCHLFAHDYNGAGSARETIMIQAGLDYDRVVPIVYYRSGAANIMVHKHGGDGHPRHYWQVDKARSLVLLCQAIKLGVVRFFQYDHKGDADNGLLHDFLALMENKIETMRGAEIYAVQRNPMLSDDFAHAVNFAVCTIWHRMQAWPDLASLAGMRLNQAQMAAAYPPSHAGRSGFFGQP